MTVEMRLYNGRLLPKVLPPFRSGTNGKYYWQYIFLMRMPSEEGYGGWLYRAFYTYESEYSDYYISGDYLYFDGSALVYELSGSGEWTKMGTVTKYFGASSGKTFDLRYFFWANTGLHHDSRNLYFFPRPGLDKAEFLEEKLPVAPVGHAAMLRGWLVGKRLAGMRGQKQEINNTARLGLGVLGRMILGKE